MVVLPCRVIEGTVQVITVGAAMETSAGMRPSATVRVRLLLQPVIGWVAVSEYTPGASTTGDEMVAFEIFPGPVHNNTEFAGLIVLDKAEEVCVQVMAVGTTGKLITGAVKSCNTLTVCEAGHPVIGFVTVSV